ncbi:MAG: hypothetical protein GC162_19600 [Planctomycetes bacterium]|nr:hypothetical protein [Planctomycetota bacterium]
MPSGKSIEAGRAYVRIFGDDSALIRTLNKQSKQLKAWGKSVATIGAGIAAAGAAVLGPILYATKQFAASGDVLDKMSQRTGITVENLSELSFAAEQSGSNLDSLEKGIKGMQRTINDANNGLGESKDALREVGLSAEALAGQSPDEQMKRIADGLASIPDDGKRAAVAMKIFGKSGQELIPLLAGGRKGMEALTAEAREFGLTVSTKASKDAAALTDAMNLMRRVVDRLVFGIGGALAPVLTELLTKTAGITAKFIKWVDANGPLIAMIAKIAAGVVAVGTAIVAVGGLIIFAGSAMGGLATILTTVGSIVGGVTAAIGAMLSPIALVIAAVASLGVYVASYFGLIDAAVSKGSEVFGVLRDDAVNAFEAIKAALSAGDISAAAAVLWALLKLEWARGITALQGYWSQFKVFMLTTAVDIAAGVASALVDSWSGLQSIWVEVTSAMAAAWSSLSASVQSIWNETTGWVAKKLLQLRGLIDDTFDTDKAIALIDQQTAAREQGIRRRESAGVAAATADRDRRLADISNQRATANANITNLAAGATGAIGANADSELAASLANLAKAQAAYKDELTNARKRSAVDKSTTVTSSPIKLPVGGPAAIATTAAKTTGTFNAFGVRRLDTQGRIARLQERAAKAAEATVDKLGRIERAIVANAPKFA